MKVFGHSGVGKTTLMESLRAGYFTGLFRRSKRSNSNSSSTPNTSASKNGTYQLFIMFWKHHFYFFSFWFWLHDFLFLFFIAVQFLCRLRQPQRFSKAAKALEQQHPHHHHLINLQAKGQLVVAVPKLKLWPGVPPSLWEPLWLLRSLEAKAIILLVLKLLLSKPKKQLKRRRQIRTRTS